MTLRALLSVVMSLTATYAYFDIGLFTYACPMSIVIRVTLTALVAMSPTATLL